MPQKNVFKMLGYPKHAKKVYDVLAMSKDAMLVTDIAYSSGLPRATIYRCLDPLVQDGLIEVTKIGKRKFYDSSSPHILKERIRLADKSNEDSLQTYLKEHEKDVPRSVRFLRGPAGIRIAFDDVISHSKKGDTFFRYTSEQDLAKVNRYLARDYRLRRDKKKLERLVISNAVSGKQKKPRLERFIKFIPPESDNFEQNIIQLVYGTRLALIDLNEEQVMIIENKQLADFQKVIFNLLYKRL